MLSKPDFLSPKEYGLPDPTQGGNLVFGAFCDETKLKSIIENGIRPRGGKPDKSSYFPNVVSLSAIGNRGYSQTDGISMGWFNLIQNAQKYGSVDVNRAYCYSFILDPEWIEKNIEKFVGVGEALTDLEFGELYKVGVLTKLNTMLRNVDEAFFEEVHFTQGILPPEALRGVIIDESDGKYLEGRSSFINTVKTIDKQNAHLRFPFGIYNKEGLLTELIG